MDRHPRCRGQGSHLAGWGRGAGDGSLQECSQCRAGQGAEERSGALGNQGLGITLMPQVSATLRKIDMYNLLFFCPGSICTVASSGYIHFHCCRIFHKHIINHLFSGRLLVILEFFPVGFAVVSKLVHRRCETEPL